MFKILELNYARSFTLMNINSSPTSTFEAKVRAKSLKKIMLSVTIYSGQIYTMQHEKELVM